jgi:ubiquinone/menaquinone biosynthesis C-methylase UbiE
VIALAKERLSLEASLADLPARKRWAAVVLSRLKRITTVPSGARILDVGAGSGGGLVAFAQLGYRCEGIEPWGPAQETAAELARTTNVSIRIVAGKAESMPFEARIFDVVHASSVIEHVADLDAALAEIYRVLKVGGVFWFSAASSLCPLQEEISGFPFFGWYPNALKLAIMNWAKDARPHLVGFTRTPAVNWFTPGKARAVLKKHGFKKVYDRWDLRGDDEIGARYRPAFRLVRRSPIARTLADIVVSGCSFAAVK